MLSAYLGAFNLLPFPALDGGRLLFLGAEAVSRRKPDAKLEARVHAIGLLMLLTLIAFVTYADVIAEIALTPARLPRGILPLSQIWERGLMRQVRRVGVRASRTAKRLV